MESLVIKIETPTGIPNVIGIFQHANGGYGKMRSIIRNY